MTTTNDIFTVAELIPEVSELLGQMTFPAYRHLLTLAPAPRHADMADQPAIQPVAIAAWVGPKPVGLVLAETPIDGVRAEATPEILSLFVLADWRSRGVGTALVGALEARLKASGFTKLAAVWMTGKSNIDAVEHILAKRGWLAPVTRTITVKFTPETAARAPWFQRVRLPGDKFEIFPWTDLTAHERDAIRRSHEAAPWIANGL